MKLTQTQIDHETNNAYNDLMCRCGLVAALKISRGIRRKLLTEKTRRKTNKRKAKSKPKRPDVGRPECGV